MIDICVSYLKSLDRIIIPKEYTYFVHCTSYRPQSVAKQDRYNRAWTELPLNGFTTNSELSCLERKDRVYSAIQYGGLKHAMTSYAKSIDSKPFQIRIIIPKKNLSEEEKVKLDADSEYLKNLYETHTGMDYRHPKIMYKERIYVFATSNYDEVTKTNEDILYGVRERDLVKYTQIVSEENNKNPNICGEHVPLNREEYSKWIYQTFSLYKNPNNNRYISKQTRLSDGTIIESECSEFEQEYWDQNTKPKGL